MPGLIELLKNKPQLDERLGRLIYGNLCPFSYNREGRATLRKQRYYQKNLSYEARTFVKMMEVQGFYRLPFRIPDEILQPVILAYRAAITDPSQATPVMSLKAKEANLNTVCYTISFDKLAILNQLLIPKIKQLVDEYYNQGQRIMFAGARRTLHIPPKLASAIDIYSNSWHCDREPSHRIKLFIALSDISEDNGPLHLLSRSRTRQLLKMGFRDRDDYGLPISEIEHPDHLYTFTGPAGSALFANVTQCLHRAGVPSSGSHRDIAEIQFTL